jgi:hypothetical protein
MVAVGEAGSDRRTKRLKLTALVQTCAQFSNEKAVRAVEGEGEGVGRGREGRG